MHEADPPPFSSAPAIPSSTASIRSPSSPAAGDPLLAFGAYIAWVQILITIAVPLQPPSCCARLSRCACVSEHLAVGVACLSFLVIQTLTLPGSHVAFPSPRSSDLCRKLPLALASALRITDHPVPRSSSCHHRSRELADRARDQMKVP